MKKLMVLFALALVASLGSAWVLAEDDLAAEVAPAAVDAVEVTEQELEGSTCEADAESRAAADQEFMRELMDELETSPMGVPSCPPITTCQGGTSECGGNASCGADLLPRDLRIKACDGNGQSITCAPGQTVHIDGGACNDCPCCSSQPFACPCPAGGCTGRARGPVYCL